MELVISPIRTGLTDPELHLVVNRPTKMVLQSADVIHDLDIPAFRMKKDVVPGRYNRMWFEPTVATAPESLGVSYEIASKSGPQVQTVKTWGEYDLYKGDDTTAFKTADLYSGDTYGFELKEGKPIAVYTRDGKKTAFNLDPVGTDPGAPAQKYSWKYHEFFQVYCAMYCGQNHSTMLAKCIVHQDPGRL